MRNKAIFIIGVSGVGKTTAGSLLAKKLNIPFFEGDDYHSLENIAKMSKGIALNDEDRFGWLKRINSLAIEKSNITSCVISCSALKKSYREILKENVREVKWCFLNGSFECIEKRIKKRKGHFMSSKLLKSQFDILEAPTKAIKIDVSLSLDEILIILKNELEDGGL